jgi:hypothetical protein
MSNPNDSEFKDEREAAAYLRVSVSGMRKWRASGAGPAYCRFGKLIRYQTSSLNEWAVSHMRKGK